MPEDVEVQETEVEESTEDTRSQIDDIVAARKEIDRLRSENAKRRTQSKEDRQLVEDAKKWREHMESQKSEMERLAETNDRLEQELASRERQIIQRDLVSEFNLDPDLAEFIVGDTEEDMRVKAEKLAKKDSLKKTSGPGDLHAGKRGKPVVKEDLTGGDFLKTLGGESKSMFQA